MVSIRGVRVLLNFGKVFTFLCGSIAVASSGMAFEPISPAAKSALSQIEVDDGFQVELVASEPLVMDPVDFDWGPDGRLWVVEMADYPLGDNGNGKPGGRVRFLEDIDGDGKYDRATLFADRLNTPNGILFWKKGVLVTACPDVLYLEDTTGDGKADHIEKLYSGFTEGNQQHRVNGLRCGLDNWVYLANGDSGGTVVSHKTGQKININGRDLRIRPETGELETQSGQTQFGRNRDDWGNWFGCNNPNPIFHFVLDEQYLKRNPHVAPPTVRRDIRSDDTLVYPIGPIISHCDTKYRKIGETPRFTSASATMVYRDNLFGTNFENVTFTSEPVYNIVHARKLTPQGVTFNSHKMHHGKVEFFRSEDPWSRPTAVHNGPDGALYIADMVREVIEHPEWIDDKLEKTLNVYSGSDMGRIYRVTPQNSIRRETIRFDKMTTAQRVAALESPSGWQRDLLQRMLIWDNDQDAVPLLRELSKQSKNPLARLHAICTLDGLGALTEIDILQRCADSHPGVRKHAIRLSEQFSSTTANQSLHWESIFAELADDTNPMIQLQLAYTLGEFSGDWTARLLAKIALKHRDDRYILAAVFSSLNKNNIYDVFLNVNEPTDASERLAIQLAAIGNKMSDHRGLNVCISNARSDMSGWKFIKALFQELGSSASSMSQHLSDENSKHLDMIIASAQTGVDNDQLSTEERIAAIQVLGHLEQHRSRDIQLLSGLIGPLLPVETQLSSIDALVKTGVGKVPKLLMENWNNHTPRVRDHILSKLLSRTSWTEELLSQIEQNRIPIGVLSQTNKSQLQQHSNMKIRQMAGKILGRIETNRQQVLLQHKPVLELIQNTDRNRLNGQKIFSKKCTVCHRIGETGFAVGPDLNAITNKSPEAIFTAILDPNRAVEAKYLQYQVITNDGKIHTGLLKEETATSLTLLASEAKLTTLLRTDIDVIQSSNQSMMPLGLEEELSEQDFADLLFYVIQLSNNK